MNELKDAIYGLAVADALGVPFEFRERGSFNCTDMVGFGTWNKEPGTWSDDTSMTLATLKSIKDNNGEIVIEDIRNNFEKWLFEAEFTADNKTFDVGNTTREAIALGEGIDNFYANGNGSLMRILPLAFIDATDEEIEEVSAIIHGHEISREACVKYVHIAKELIQGKYDLLNDFEVTKPIKSDGFVENNLNTAIYCIKTTDSYEEAVLKVVNLGEDTDTTGAVAGGLAGIIYGYENIPKNWREILKNKELIDSLVL